MGNCLIVTNCVEYVARSKRYNNNNNNDKNHKRQVENSGWFWLAGWVGFVDDIFNYKAGETVSQSASQSARHVMHNLMGNKCIVTVIQARRKRITIKKLLIMFVFPDK